MRKSFSYKKHENDELTALMKLNTFHKKESRNEENELSPLKKKLQLNNAERFEPKKNNRLKQPNLEKANDKINKFILDFFESMAVQENCKSEFSSEFQKFNKKDSFDKPNFITRNDSSVSLIHYLRRNSTKSHLNNTKRRNSKLLSDEQNINRSFSTKVYPKNITRKISSSRKKKEKGSKFGKKKTFEEKKKVKYFKRNSDSKLIYKSPRKANSFRQKDKKTESNSNNNNSNSNMDIKKKRTLESLTKKNFDNIENNSSINSLNSYSSTKNQISKAHKIFKENNKIIAGAQKEEIMKVDSISNKYKNKNVLTAVDFTKIQQGIRKSIASMDSEIKNTIVSPMNKDFSKINSLPNSKANINNKKLLKKKTLNFDKNANKTLSEKLYRHLKRNKKMIYDSLDDEEYEDEEEINNLYISPDSWYIYIHDSIIALMSIICLFYIPYYLAHDPLLCTNYYSFRFFIFLLVDIFFIIDLVIGFFRAYYNFDEYLMKTIPDMSYNYFQNWFFSDFFEAVPLFSINYYLECCQNGHGKKNEIISINKSYPYIIIFSSFYTNVTNKRFFYLLYLNKTLKIFKTFSGNRAIIKLEDILLHFDFIEHFSKLLKYILFFSVICNLGTCLFIFIGRNSDPGWIVNFQLDKKNFIQVYIAGLYYLMATITTVGYGDILGQTPVEYVFQIFILIAGTCTYSWIITSFSNYIKKKQEESFSFEKKIKILEDIKRTNPHLQNDLYFKILRHLKYKKYNEKNKKNLVMDSLPYSLRNLLIIEMYKPIIDNFTFFKNFENSNFIAQVVMAFKPILAIKNDVLFQEGDFIEDIIFVKKGMICLEICINLDKPKESIEKIINGNNGKQFKPIFNRRMSSDFRQSMLLYGKDINELIDDKKEEEEETKNVQYLKIVYIRKNEHFGETLMFLNQRSPCSAKVKSKKAELFFLKKTDAIDISNTFQNIWRRINKKSLFNLQQIKHNINKALLNFCNRQGIKLGTIGAKLNNILKEDLQKPTQEELSKNSSEEEEEEESEEESANESSQKKESAINKSLNKSQSHSKTQSQNSEKDEEKTPYINSVIKEESSFQKEGSDSESKSPSHSKYSQNDTNNNYQSSEKKNNSSCNNTNSFFGNEFKSQNSSINNYYNTNTNKLSIYTKKYNTNPYKRKSRKQSSKLNNSNFIDPNNCSQQLIHRHDFHLSNNNLSHSAQKDDEEEVENENSVSSNKIGSTLLKHENETSQIEKVNFIVPFNAEEINDEIYHNETFNLNLEQAKKIEVNNKNIDLNNSNFEFFPLKKKSSIENHECEKTRYLEKILDQYEGNINAISRPSIEIKNMRKKSFSSNSLQPYVITLKQTKASSFSFSSSYENINKISGNKYKKDKTLQRKVKYFIEKEISDPNANNKVRRSLICSSLCFNRKRMLSTDMHKTNTKGSNYTKKETEERNKSYSKKEKERERERDKSSPIKKLKSINSLKGDNTIKMSSSFLMLPVNNNRGSKRHSIAQIHFHGKENMIRRNTLLNSPIKKKKSKLGLKSKDDVSNILDLKGLDNQEQEKSFYDKIEELQNSTNLNNNFTIFTPFTPLSPKRKKRDQSINIIDENIKQNYQNLNAPAEYFTNCFTRMINLYNIKKNDKGDGSINSSKRLRYSNKNGILNETSLVESQENMRKPTFIGLRRNSTSSEVFDKKSHARLNKKMNGHN